MCGGGGCTSTASTRVVTGTACKTRRENASSATQSSLKKLFQKTGGNHANYHADNTSALVPLTTFVVTVIASALLYSRSLYSDVPGGDAGEVLAEACLLGAAHPPGYPLLIGVTHMWLKLCALLVGETSFSFSSNSDEASSTGALLFSSQSSSHASSSLSVLSKPTTCANSLNALFASFAAGFVALAVDEGGGGGCRRYDGRSRRSSDSGTSGDWLKAASQRIVAGCVGGLGFATTPLVWTYAIGFEVFALNNLLCAVLLWLTCRVLRLSQLLTHTSLKKEVRICSAIGSFVCGLALSNQHTAVLFEAPLILFVVAALYRTNNLFPVEIGACFFLGLSPYLLLWYVGVHPKPGSWGDTSTLAGLVKHVLRQEYGTLRLSPVAAATASDQGWGMRTTAYFEDVAEQFTLVGFALALLSVAQNIFNVGTTLLSHNTTNPHQASSNTKRPSKSRSKKKKRLLGGNAGGAQTTTRSDSANVDTPATSSSRALVPPCLGLIHVVGVQLPPLVIAFVVYIGIFHSLANLPLENAMAREVLRRFWMQPNLLFGIWLGAGVHVACGSGSDNSSTTTSSTSSTITKTECGGRLIRTCRRVRTSVVLTLSVAWLSWHVQTSAYALGLGRMEFVSPFASSSSSWQSWSSFIRFENEEGHAVATGTVGRYARAILMPLPNGAIVLSHNDLNWNAARAVQACEGVRQDVTHLSLQMMPYSWFASQQRPLYARSQTRTAATATNSTTATGSRSTVKDRVGGIGIGTGIGGVVFPATPRNMSTNRASRSNLEQIAAFASANLLHGRRPVFVDLHAVNNRDIQEDSMYADTGLRFVPEGLLWRAYLAQGTVANAYVTAQESTAAAAVTTTATTTATVELTAGSRDALAWLPPVSRGLGTWQSDTQKQIHWLREKNMKPLAYMYTEQQQQQQQAIKTIIAGTPTSNQLNKQLANVYGAGTWEHAAATMSWDALYQRALHLLTCAMSRDVGDHQVKDERKGNSKKDNTKIMKTGFSHNVLARVAVLDESARLLEELVEVEATARTLTADKHNVQKNCALASVKLLQALSIAATTMTTTTTTTSSPVRSVKTILTQLTAQKSKTRLALERFALAFPQDKDATNFFNIARSKALQDTPS